VVLSLVRGREGVGGFREAGIRSGEGGLPGVRGRQGPQHRRQHRRVQPDVRAGCSLVVDGAVVEGDKAVTEQMWFAIVEL
jgi:hypothetical protein